MPGSKNAAWDTRAQSADMNRVVLAARIGIFAALLGRLEEIGAEQVRPCISRLAPPLTSPSKGALKEGEMT